jgi:hypothetical protein
VCGANISVGPSRARECGVQDFLAFFFAPFFAIFLLFVLLFSGYFFRGSALFFFAIFNISPHVRICNEKIFFDRRN